MKFRYKQWDIDSSNWKLNIDSVVFAQTQLHFGIITLASGKESLQRHIKRSNIY